MLARLGESGIYERARERVHRLTLAGEVGLEIADERFVGALLIEGAHELILGGPDALDVLLEAVEEEEFDRITRGAQTGSARIPHRRHGPVEDVEQYGRARAGRVAFVPA